MLFRSYYLGTNRDGVEPLSFEAALEIARAGEARVAELDLAQMKAAADRLREELCSILDVTK